MSKAYVATSEYAQILCAYDRNPAKALKKVAKLIDTMYEFDKNVMLVGINVNYDEESYYHVTATVSTVMIGL